MAATLSTPTIITLQSRRPTLPTASDPLIAARLPFKRIAVRALGVGSLVDEFIWFDPSGLAGAAAGWWLLEQAVWEGDQRTRLFRQPATGPGTAIEYAFRCGTSGVTYPTGYTVTGRYHGEKCDASSISIKIDGVGPNLQDTANWAEGTVKRGTSTFSIESTPRLLRGSTEVASIPSFFQGVFVGIGLQEIGALAPLPGITDLALQDSPVGMHAISNSAFSSAKLSNEARTVSLTQSGTQKGNWRKSELSTTPGSGQDTMQCYRPTDSLSNALISEARAAQGPAVQNTGSTLTPWQLCQFGCVHVADEALYAKFAPYAMSTPETGSPGEYALGSGQVLRFQTLRRARRGAVA